jgi:hypothetical protein
VVVQLTLDLAPTYVHNFSRPRIFPIFAITSHPNPTGYLDDDSTVDIVARRGMVRVQCESTCDQGISKKCAGGRNCGHKLEQDPKLIEKPRRTRKESFDSAVFQSTVVHLIVGRHLIASTPPNLTQVKIWEYLKMETLIEHN